MNMAHLAFDGEDTKLYTLYKEAQDLRTLFTPTRNVRLSKVSADSYASKSSYRDSCLNSWRICLE